MKKHFDITEWADLLRGVKAPEDEQRMRSHLDSPCSDCRQLVSSLTVVRDALHAGPPQDAPDAVVRLARAIFPASATKRSIWRELTAALMFDSKLEPLPAGVRGDATQARQLVYRAGTIEIDLQIETDPQAKTIIVGQISDGRSETPYADCEVHLVSGRKVVGIAESNEFGEFSLAADKVCGGALRFLMFAEGVHVELPLAAVSATDEGNSDGGRTTT